MTRVQVCGVTNTADALMCEEEGVNSLGFVLFENRMRSVTPSMVKEMTSQLSSSISRVAIIHHKDIESMMRIALQAEADIIQTFTKNLDDLLLLQDHGFRVINSILIDVTISSLDMPIENFIEISEACEMILFEPSKGGIFGGIGIGYDYRSVLPQYTQFCNQFAIAGGLSPTNVHEALDLKPHTVNVSSGVEDSSGCKDRQLVREFVRRCNVSVIVEKVDI
ncbi:MAG: phosphoribosylanthranilate isomerase [Candidatus Thorarchaeota archaeon]|nr:MAG: phosphoribosylanthranilate isomerase [Candidatus Thorarchaeota archaeon]